MQGIETPVLESACKAVQDCFASAPVIVLGSGHSCASGLPDMSQLAAHLCSTVPNEAASADQGTWRAVEEKLRTMPLEMALHDIQLGPELTDVIIRKTWDCITPTDKAVLDLVIQDSAQLPLSRLFRHLFNSTHPRIQVVTTNYDCLAEYAADAAGYAWATGFGYGYVGARWGNHLLTIYKGATAFRMVDVWKVHGSLNWYRAPDGTTYYLPSVNAIPSGYQPVIVTPGTDKYRKTHAEPFRTVMAGADSAMEDARGFLCVGYGFNDEHIQPKLLEKCRHEQRSIIVLAKTLTAEAKKVLLDGTCKRFLAFEESGDGTRVFSVEARDGVELPGVNLWSLGSLLDRVM